MNLKKISISVTILILITFLVVKVNNYINILVIPEFETIAGYAECMLTISTVLMGFAFTVMGLLYTFDASAFVKKLKSTDYVIKRANSIMFCLWILGIASLAYVILIVFNVKKIYEYVYVFSLASFIWGIVLFIISTKDVYELIKSVHRYDQKRSEKKYEAYCQEKQKRKTENKIQNDEDDIW